MKKAREGNLDDLEALDYLDTLDAQYTTRGCIRQAQIRARARGKRNQESQFARQLRRFRRSWRVEISPVEVARRRALSRTRQPRGVQFDLAPT